MFKDVGGVTKELLLASKDNTWAEVCIPSNISTKVRDVPQDLTNGNIPSFHGKQDVLSGALQG